MAVDVHLPSAGFDCSDTNNKFEFLFDRSKDMDNPKVYRRIKGKFVLIGNLLAEKQGAYVIWEDKYFFTTTDFAWTFVGFATISTGSRKLRSFHDFASISVFIDFA